MKKIDGIEFKNNAFDALRLFAALSVVLVHFTKFYIQIVEEGNNGYAVMAALRAILLRIPGVLIFFAISGLLVSASFERSFSIKDFIRKRLIRIYPELWLNTIINIVIIIFLAHELLDKSFILWITTQIFGVAFTPGCLKNFATGSVNGALWTVFVEIQLYIVTAVFYRYLKRLLLWQWGIALLAALFLNCAGSLIKFNSILDKAIERCFLPYMIWYLIGVFAYVNKDRVLPVLAKYALWLLAVYVVYCFLPTAKIGYYSDAATSILLPFLTIGLSYKLGSIRLKRDLSYSIFLYHWIILNVIIYFNLFTKLHWILCLVLYLAAVFAASYINCLLVEKPMLRLKNRGVRFNILLKRS